MLRIDPPFARRLGYSSMVTFEMFRLETNVETFQADDVIFRKGDPRTIMYAIQEGEVDIKLGEKLIETVGSNGIFGEMAMVDGSPPTDCTLVPIDQKRFQLLVQQTPFFAIQVMQLLVQRLRSMDKQIVA